MRERPGHPRDRVISSISKTSPVGVLGVRSCVYLHLLHTHTRMEIELTVRVCSAVASSGISLPSSELVGPRSQRSRSYPGARSLSASGQARTQLPCLMGREPRQQSRAGHDGQTHLLRAVQGVHLEPVLFDPSIDESVELEPEERDASVGRRKALKLARVGAFEVDALCDKVTFADRVLHCRCEGPRKRRRSRIGIAPMPRSPSGKQRAPDSREHERCIGLGTDVGLRRVARVH